MQIQAWQKKKQAGASRPMLVNRHQISVIRSLG